MHAEVITIGSEILSGHTPETNFRTIATRLGEEGIPISRHTVVPDAREALGDVLRNALARSPLVVTTGGLGGTPDDVTRRVMASALGRKLIFRDSLLAELQAKLAERGRRLAPSLEALALVPAGAQALPNPVGLAPGLLLRTDDSVLFALPGVPLEMERMLDEVVLTWLRGEGMAGSLVAETLRTVGIPESRLAEWVPELLGEGLQVSYLPAAGRVDLRLTTTTGEKGRPELAATVGRLAERLGPLLYARGSVSLEEAILALLRRARRRLGVAESLTGGRIGAALTGVPGSSEVFLGSLATYSDSAKAQVLGVATRTLERYGAVSARVAREMAEGARRVLGADVAIATTGIAGPGGGTAEKPVGLVFCAYSDMRTTKSFRFRFGGTRELIQDLSVTVALNVLRLALVGRLDLLSPATREGSASG